MAAKGLGRGLESLLVDVPTEMGLDFVSQDDKYHVYQTQQQLLREAEQLKELIIMFEHMVLQLNIISIQVEI